VTEIIIRCY